MSQHLKKKRYEGLIQFKDFLRQNLVCLQAAMQSSFATAVQSPLVATLDATHTDCHHLLLGLKAHNDLSKVTKLTKSDYLLMRIVQLQEQLFSPISWKLGDNHIGVWIDASDSLANQYLFNLLNNLVLDKGRLDRRTHHHWGSVSKQYTVSTKEDAVKNMMHCLGHKQVETSVLDQLENAIYGLWPKLEKPETISISSDGQYISLTVNGRLFTDRKQFNESLDQLRNIPSHCISASSSTFDQVDICIPIRFFKQLELKGFFAYYYRPSGLLVSA